MNSDSEDHGLAKLQGAGPLLMVAAHSTLSRPRGRSLAAIAAAPVPRFSVDGSPQTVRLTAAGPDVAALSRRAVAICSP